MTDTTNVQSNQTSSSLDDRLSKLRVQLPPPKLNKAQNADVSYEYGSFGVENRIESPVPSKARQSFGGILNYLNVQAEPVQQPTKAKDQFQAPAARKKDTNVNGKKVTNDYPPMSPSAIIQALSEIVREPPLSPTLQPLNGDDMGAALENMLEAQDTMEHTDSSDSSSDQVMKDTPDAMEEQPQNLVLAAIAEPIERATPPAEPIKEMQPLKDVEKDTTFRIEKKQTEQPPKQQEVQQAKKPTEKSSNINGDDRKRSSKEDKPSREEKKPSKPSEEKMAKPVSKPSKPVEEKKREEERKSTKRTDEGHESKKRPREDAEENEREKKRLKTTPPVPTKADVSPARTDMATPASTSKFPTHNNVWKIGEVLKRKADEMEATNNKGNECISLYIKAGLKFLEACYLREHENTESVGIAFQQAARYMYSIANKAIGMKQQEKAGLCYATTALAHYKGMVYKREKLRKQCQESSANVKQQIKTFEKNLSSNPPSPSNPVTTITITTTSSELQKDIKLGRLSFDMMQDMDAFLSVTDYLQRSEKLLPASMRVTPVHTSLYSCGVKQMIEFVESCLTTLDEQL